MMIEGIATLEHPMAWTRGVLRVRLLDVDRIDAPAIPIAEKIVRPGAGRSVAEIAFSFEVRDDLASNRRYELAAHLDLNADGRVARGDFVTMEAFPWRPGDHTPARIRLRRVQ